MYVGSSKEQVLYSLRTIIIISEIPINANYDYSSDALA